MIRFIELYKFFLVLCLVIFCGIATSAKESEGYDDDFSDDNTQIQIDEIKKDKKVDEVKLNSKSLKYFMSFSLVGSYTFQYANALVYSKDISPYDFVTFAGLLGTHFQMQFQFKPSVSFQLDVGWQTFNFNNFSGIYLDVETTKSTFIPVRSLIFFSLDNEHLISVGAGITLWFALPVEYQGTVDVNSGYTNVLLSTAFMIRTPSLSIAFSETSSLLPFWELGFDLNMTSGLQNNAQFFESLDFRFIAKFGLSLHIIR